MHQVLEKVKQKVMAKESCRYNPMTRVVSEQELKEVLDEINVEYNNGWISVGKRLPEEPKGKLESIELIENAIDAGELSEYIVTIADAKKATTLYYAGNGCWYDLMTEEFYQVIAWQPLPESYDSAVH